ncbi:MAG: type II CRISPR-associated endonuclease Cas1 [Flavobacteriaceae bacterium]
MIKRTLYFANECYLSTQKQQLVVRYPDGRETKSVPIEDIGVVLLDHYRLTLTATLLNKLLGNNVAVITCDAQHLPLGMFLNLNGHSLQQEHFARQIVVTQAKKDRLWKQVIQAKISNQAALLMEQGTAVLNMERWAKQVKNGDPNNLEARAANYYWRHLFGDIKFTRERFGAAPNGLLNYGYTILRGIVARALVGSGLLPTLGIHHHNKYNAYCLADDLMEPYRPYVDAVVVKLAENGVGELTPQSKKELLQIPVLDVSINQQKSPLMLAVQQSAASLQQCYAGQQKTIKLPQFV